MKKLLLLMLMFMVNINIFAQESKVDSLQHQLNQLQHDYDYLYCNYELNRLINQMAIDSNRLNSSANRLLIYFYHTGFINQMYEVYKDDLSSSVLKFNVYESSVEVHKESISKKIKESDFTDSELFILNSNLETLDLSLQSFKSSINYYKTVLDMYKDLY